MKKSRGYPLSLLYYYLIDLHLLKSFDLELTLLSKRNNGLDELLRSRPFRKGARKNLHIHARFADDLEKQKHPNRFLEKITLNS